MGIETKPSAHGNGRAAEWRSRLAIFVSGLLLFEAASGLSIWLLPFSVSNQLLVLLHTAAGVLFLLPYLVYQGRHWWIYRSRTWSHIVLTGYVAFVSVALNTISGVVLTAQALFGTWTSPTWDAIHIVTTIAIVGFAIPHIALLILRDRKSRSDEGLQVLRAERRFMWLSLSWSLAGLSLLVLWGAAYQPITWRNEFPEGYEFEQGKSPFQPSLARTTSGGAYDDRSLTGSKRCGTSGCHQAIYDEWSVSAHRWSSMDPAFQSIQEVMAKQNGPTSTRYCGGCHDPASLFAGTKNVMTEDLSSVHGYDEGVSCLVCHAIRKTDLKGNANYVINQPQRYAFELSDHPAAKLASDFLIRAYPKKHVEVFSKRLFKTPEYCAACHKQFIDEEVNKVGWVQLQNQYDNWRKSKWNPGDDPDKVVECRECHMPLQDSYDPANGDDLDSYRSRYDGRHRDHRFIGSNTFVPALLDLPHREEHRKLTEAWLQGKREIPEIADKWAAGPAVDVKILSPDVVRPGEEMEIRVVISSNKVGHDFPTGPLDIIQSWIHLEVTDDRGQVLLSSGALDEDHFIAPGAFMFKAEPVDRYGNLIDRHNLWEMVGVRYRRAIFPGFSDVARYTLACPSTLEARTDGTSGPKTTPGRDFSLHAPNSAGTLRLEASLDYRKVDQFLLNFIYGKDNELTSPVIRMSADKKTVRVGES